MNRNFKEVKYLDSVGHVVIQQQMKNNILKRLEEWYGLNLSQSCDKYFCFMNQDDINELLDYNYLCSYNIKSRKIFLYLTIYSGINFTFYIDKHEIISVKHRFSKDLYEKDTLFEGELVPGYTLLSDIIIYQGEKTAGKSGLEKIKLLNTTIDKKYVPDVILDVSKVVVKDFVHYSQLESFWEDYKKTLPYKNKINGLIFRPTDKTTRNIVLNENKCNISVEKAKKDIQQKITEKIDTNKFKTVCFKMYKTKKPDVYQLFLLDKKNKKELLYDIASIPDIITSKKIKKMIGKHKYLMVNCKYDTLFKRWKPIRKSTRKNPDDIGILF